jgi:hypothetical protein
MLCHLLYYLAMQIMHNTPPDRPPARLGAAPSAASPTLKEPLLYVCGEQTLCHSWQSRRANPPGATACMALRAKSGSGHGFPWLLGA